MYSAQDTPHKMYNLSGNYPTAHITTHNACKTHVSVQMPPSLGLSGEPGHPLFDFAF